MARSFSKLLALLREVNSPPKGGEQGDLRLAEGLIAFSFGEAKSARHPQAGRSNRALADLVLDVLERYTRLVEPGKKLVPAVQAEITRHFSRTLASKCTIGTPFGYADTRQVSESAASLLQKNNRPIKNLALLAHHRHFPRARATLEALGYAVVHNPHLMGVPYDPQNAQEWVRNDRAFRFHESIAIMVYWLRGWI